MQISLPGLLVRLAYSVCTLYMMMIVLNWTASWLQIDVHDRRIRWMSRLTDPLIQWMRTLLPPMGPFDFGPLAALFAVLICRWLSVGLLARAAYGL